MSGFDIITRILLAALLGGLVGLEREAAKRAAGLRTHTLVSVGSALIMMTSIHLYELYAGVADVDPSRIAAQVVSGIGFLGAGTIIRSGRSISGLTTAATLWVVSAVGLAVGCGFWKAAVFTTATILIGLIIFGRVVHRYFPDTDT